MPAWLSGSGDLLRDVPQIHIERIGIRLEEPRRAMELLPVSSKDQSSLVTIVSLKDEPAPLAPRSPLPEQVVVSAALLPLAPAGITVWRELGRLVAGITTGEKMVYASPLSSTRMDERAVAELNNICLQLSFQRVLGKVERIVLWLPGEEADPARIGQLTGLPASREPRPSWTSPRSPVASSLMPADLAWAHRVAKAQGGIPRGRFRRGGRGGSLHRAHHPGRPRAR
jgi:hypothetical protein